MSNPNLIPNTKTIGGFHKVLLFYWTTLGGQTYCRFVEAYFTKLYIHILHATQYKVNTYEEYLNRPTTVFPFVVEQQALNVSRDLNLPTVLYLWPWLKSSMVCHWIIFCGLNACSSNSLMLAKKINFARV